MKEQNEILISILTYNSAKVIEDCILSIKNQTDQNFKCFVFDNNSEDNIKEVVSKYDFIKFIQVGSNGGYTGGNNFAFNYFKKHYPKHSYIMILNPDTVLDNNLLKEYQDMFLIQNVELYSCSMKEYGNEIKAGIPKNIHVPSFTFFGKIITKSESQLKFIDSLWVLGSCFVVNLKKYKEEYLFKDYFMYHDEIELSIRVKLNGGKVLTSIKSSVSHRIKKSSDVMPKSIYLLELNRLKLQADLFSNWFVFLNLPLYLFSRLMITLIYKPLNHYPHIFKGIGEGLFYLFKNINNEKPSLKKTLYFLFIENSKYASYNNRIQ